MFKLKLILLSGAMAFSAQTVQAQTCATQPTCSELGYTLTSTTNCAGTVLKCPFDKSKYYCTQKNEVVNIVMPSFGSGKSLGINTLYTLGSSTLASYKCGWVSFVAVAGSGSCYFYINNQTVGRSTVDNALVAPVSGTDNFKLSSGCATASLTFYPCRVN